MVIVESGPALSMGMPRLLANNVGSQFFVAHPGRLGTAKKKRMIQNAQLDNTTPKLCSSPPAPGF